MSAHGNSVGPSGADITSGCRATSSSVRPPDNPTAASNCRSRSAAALAFSTLITGPFDTWGCCTQRIEAVK